jgi:hypothetical protein
MAKFKAAGSRKKATASNARAIPCVIVIAGIFVVVLLLFYALLKSGS